MLSISNVSAGMAATGYYTKESYYAKEQEEAKAASSWFGGGAAAAGLSGPVDTGAFNRILDGVTPDGRQLGRIVDGERVHAPGTDLTFSAPKSVSILGLVVKDERVISAHDEAVRATLGWAEQRLIQTRVVQDGKVVPVEGQKMVAGLFRQDTSRNLDPQLHTHAVIANMVQGPDGQWRSLHNKQLYENKMFLGQFYRAELAARLERIGYRCEVTHDDGRFEVSSVPKEVIAAFSTRSADIREAMADYDVKNAKTAENAALMTREVKKDQTAAELQGQWRETAKEHGLDAVAFKRPGLGRGDGSWLAGARSGLQILSARVAGVWESFANRLPGTRESADAAVKFAIEHLAERNAAFRDIELIEAATKHVYGRFTPSQILEAVERAVGAGELIRSTNSGRDYRDTYTVPSAVGIERQIEQLLKEGAGAGAVVMDSATAAARLVDSPLNGGQRESAIVILSSRDRHAYVQGYAGVGKTTMVNSVRELGEAEGFEFLGLAPTASAAGTLQAETGIPSQTLQSFLVEHEKIALGTTSAAEHSRLRSEFEKTIIILDESSFSSNQQERDLLVIANRLGVPRLAQLGDVHQHGAVEAGKPFARMQEGIVPGARMTDIRRQRSPDLKEAVTSSLANDVERAFAKIGATNIHEADYGEKGSPEAAAAVAWLRLTPRERDGTMIVTQNKAQRTAVNRDISEGLIAEGRVSGAHHDQAVLQPKNLTNAELHHARYYQVGNSVIFHRGLEKQGVAVGKTMKVERVDAKKSVVHLRDGKDRIALRPGSIPSTRKHGIAVYEAGLVRLQAGLTVRWTANDRDRGLVNSHTATVEKVEQQSVTFRLENGRTVTMTKDDPQLRFLDYGYAVTSIGAQGRTVDRVFGVFSGAAQFTTNQRSFYVTISRARDEARLFVYDRERTIEKIRETTGAKLSAIEATSSSRKELLEFSAYPVGGKLETSLDKGLGEISR